MKPHKHKKLIHIWADGADIQFQNSIGQWEDCGKYPCWDSETEYRPAPTKYARMFVTTGKTSEPLVATSYTPEQFNPFDLHAFRTWVGDWHSLPHDNVPLPYADVIKAWANGASIETKQTGCCWDFLGCPDVVRWNVEDAEYRVVKTEWVRLYRTCGGIYDWTACRTICDDTHNLPHFREWVGDWNEVRLD